MLATAFWSFNERQRRKREADAYGDCPPRGDAAEGPHCTRKELAVGHLAAVEVEAAAVGLIDLSSSVVFSVRAAVCVVPPVS